MRCGLFCFQVIDLDTTLLMVKNVQQLIASILYSLKAKRQIYIFAQQASLEFL